MLLLAKKLILYQSLYKVWFFDIVCGVIVIFGQIKFQNLIKNAFVNCSKYATSSERKQLSFMLIAK